jgi:hypothetical protein
MGVKTSEGGVENACRIWKQLEILLLSSIPACLHVARV